jgi:hypothetical protein
VSSQAAADPLREANRITQPVAGALCQVFDVGYRILLASLRGALSRDRSIPTDAAVRTKYAAWALEEILSTIKSLATAIMRLPCKDGGTTAQIAAARAFVL